MRHNDYCSLSAVDWPVEEYVTYTVSHYTSCKTQSYYRLWKDEAPVSCDGKTNQTLSGCVAGKSFGQKEGYQPLSTCA